MRVMFSQTWFVLLSLACQRPNPVPMICNASDIYCLGLLGKGKGKRQRKSQGDRWKEDEAVCALGESRSDGLME